MIPGLDYGDIMYWMLIGIGTLILVASVGFGLGLGVGALSFLAC